MAKKAADDQLFADNEREVKTVREKILCVPCAVFVLYVSSKRAFFARKSPSALRVFDNNRDPDVSMMMPSVEWVHFSAERFGGNACAIVVIVITFDISERCLVPQTLRFYCGNNVCLFIVCARVGYFFK